VFGTDLTKDGAYAKSATTFAETVELDLEGRLDARLQLWRWLAVEDGFYDHARILINDELVWSNKASATEPQDSLDHLDREWRFADFDLAPHGRGTGKVKLRFELESDEGLQLGGWTLDDVCIVYPSVAPPPDCEGEDCADPSDPMGDDADLAGCCSSARGGPSALGLGLLVLGLVLRRRRR
jgi:MYXO-CTERM domain-containing protein